MARKKSIEAQLFDNLTKTALGRVRKSAFGGGRGKKPTGWGVVATLLVLLLVSWFQTRDGADSNSDLRSVPDRETVQIERCVDGDTFVVLTSDGATERVRLIGANAPETVKPNWPVEPFGPEASAFSKRRVEEAGGIATLVSDGDRRDKYDRRLAFLYLGDSQVSLNEELASAGLARVETKYRYSSKMKKRLTDAERVAKKERRGIYSDAE